MVKNYRTGTTRENWNCLPNLSTVFLRFSTHPSLLIMSTINQTMTRFDKGAPGQAGLRSYHSIKSQCKHHRNSVCLVEPEFGFIWWGHDLSVLSKGRKWTRARRKFCTVTHYESHDILRKHLWSRAVPSQQHNRYHANERQCTDCSSCQHLSRIWRS